MKKIIVFFIALLLLFVACGKDEAKEPTAAQVQAVAIYGFNNTYESISAAKTYVDGYNPDTTALMKAARFPSYDTLTGWWTFTCNFENPDTGFPLSWHVAESLQYIDTLGDFVKFPILGAKMFHLRTHKELTIDTTYFKFDYHLDFDGMWGTRRDGDTISVNGDGSWHIESGDNVFDMAVEYDNIIWTWILSALDRYPESGRLLIDYQDWSIIFTFDGDSTANMVATSPTGREYEREVSLNRSGES